MLKKKHKIKAYTLMEVTVAMLLSALCITICYTAYNLITNYYSSFQQQNEQTASMLILKHVMEVDFIKSSYCLKNGNDLLLTKDSTAICYSITPNYITRRINELHTDTFKLQTTLPKSYFENNEVLTNDTIDQIRFNVITPKNGVVPFQLTKNYSAENLFH